MNIQRSIPLALAAIAVALFAPRASADTLTPENSLYLVISQNYAEFGTYDGSEDGESITGSVNLPENAQGRGLTNGYVVINFLAFTGGTYPGGLTAVVYEGLLSSLGLSIEELGGHQFFLLGSFEEHLMLGAAMIPGNFPNPLPDDWEAGILAGLRNIGALGESILLPGGVVSVSDDEFWGHFQEYAESEFSDVDFADLINPDGPFVGWQVYSSLDALGGGSENVFGFTDPLPIGLLTIGEVNGNPGGTFTSYNDLQNPVPEPSTLALLAGGLVVAARRRRKARAQAA